MEENNDMEVEIDGVKIEQVTQYKYPGARIEEIGNIEPEINERIQSASKLFYALNRVILNNKKITARTKMIVYKVIYRPTLLHGRDIGAK